MKGRSFRLLLSRRFWQRSAFALASLATLIAAAYAIENYRGEKAWVRYRAEAEARGTKLDFKDFIPPPIPDEENFAAIPIYQDLISEDATVRERATKACVLPDECRRYIGQGEPVDFSAIRNGMVESGLLSATTGNVVADVLRGLEKYEPVLVQMRQAASRPRSRLDAHWEKGIDSDFFRMGGGLTIGQVISLRVSALLANERADEAFQEWRLLIKQADVYQGEPTVLAGMIRVMLSAYLTNSFKELLAARALNDDDLSRGCSDLGGIDLMADFTSAMSSERAMQNGMFDRVRVNPTVWSAYLTGDPSKPPKWSWTTPIPKGWFARNQWHLNEWWDHEIARAKAAQDLALSEMPSPTIMIPQSWLRSPYWFAVRTVAYLVGGNQELCRKIQTEVELCLVASALERFRLRYGVYPKEPSELIPEILPKIPRDRFDGKPLRYRRAYDGGVILYSVGEDCRDDGGNESNDAVWRAPSIGLIPRNH